MQESKRKQIFEDWLAQYRGLLFKVVRAYATEPADQDDLFQEVALQVWKSIPNFRAESKVTTWLYRVALQTAWAWTRRERRHRDHRQELAAEATLLRPGDEPAGGDDGVDVGVEAEVLSPGILGSVKVVELRRNGEHNMLIANG
jgi:RNA polymerase sigma factor (sigma-70 family)